MKTVIYTIITGDYDTLKQPRVVTPGVDYVVFTDNERLNFGIWKRRPIPEEVKDYSNVKKQRYVKICAHKVLPEYELSVYVDGSIEVLRDITQWIANTLKSGDGKSVFIPTHPARKCIYRECKACQSLKKDTRENIERQVKFLKDNGMPENAGLVQSNIILRKHNEEYCVKLMEDWWSVLKEYSHRDQLSFNYVLWKNGEKGFKYIDKSTCNSSYFKWWSSHPKVKKQPETKQPSRPFANASMRIRRHFNNRPY